MKYATFDVSGKNIDIREDNSVAVPANAVEITDELFNEMIATEGGGRWALVNGVIQWVL